MKVLEAKIAEKQKVYDSACKEADAQCKQEVADAYTRRDTVKETMANDMVQEIVGKFL